MRSELKDKCKGMKTKPGCKCMHGVECWFQKKCWYYDSHSEEEKMLWNEEEKLRNEQRQLQWRKKNMIGPLRHGAPGVLSIPHESIPSPHEASHQDVSPCRGWGCSWASFERFRCSSFGPPCGGVLSEALDRVRRHPPTGFRGARHDQMGPFAIVKIAKSPFFTV